LKLEVGKFSFTTVYSDQISAPRVITVDRLADLPPGSFEVFEPLVPPGVTHVVARRAHNRIPIYSWGDELCCLPMGATSCTLVDGRWMPAREDDKAQGRHRGEPQGGKKGQPAPKQEVAGEYERSLTLQPGDYVLFQEVISPVSGLSADANPAHRHVVRLTRVQPRVDELYRMPLMEIEWAPEDALPFELCVSATGRPPECAPVRDAVVVNANLVLVDHGRTQSLEPLGVVPLKEREPECDGCAGNGTNTPGRFRPYLRRPGLTFADPLPARRREGGLPPAAALRLRDGRAAIPQVKLQGVRPRPDGSGPLFDLLHLPENYAGPTGNPADLVEEWLAQPDLLASAPFDRHFTVEMDDGRRAWVRFGDDSAGRQPPAGTGFYARYRTGSGEQGNVGADSLTVLALDGLSLDGVAIEVTNPLPAWGGAEPEPLDQVRLLAPHAFRAERVRAVTADDYAELVMRGFAGKLQRAAARLTWTGSLYEVCVVVDPLGNVALTLDDPFLDEIRERLMDHRRMGHDLVVRPARYVPVRLGLRVCVLPGYLRGHVKTTLLDRFSDRRLRDGSLGFFHPDRQTFGEGVALSKVIAAAASTPGVESVTVTRLERYASPSSEALRTGLLPMDLFEIARLDNDPNQPDNGRFELTLEGGR
jgi:hypothetical protein